MASFNEMLESSFFLIVTTVVLILITFTAGIIMDWLAIWLSDQPAGIIPASPVQYVFGTFYGMILAIEAGLFVQFYLTTIRKTDYSTGENEF